MIFLNQKVEKINIFIEDGAVFIFVGKQEVEEIFEYNYLYLEDFESELNQLKEKNNKLDQLIIFKTFEKLPKVRISFTELILVFLGVAVLLFIYFIPSYIAYKKSFFNQIFALNIFLGLTFIGWVICLVWSLKREG